MSVQPLSHEQTVGILNGPRNIPGDATNRIESMLTDGVPIVDIDRFSEVIVGLTVEAPASTDEAIDANYHSIVALGSCSLEMAWLQAGDVYIPRPRRLYEHNQSALNTHDRVFGALMTDPRDRLLKPMFSLQDGGKTHAAALALLANPADPRPSRGQAVQNNRIADNVLDPLPPDILTTDEKTVIKLLIQQTSIGTALYRHSEKDVPLDEVITDAEAELDRLREQCPPEYRDRFDDYLLVSYLTDAGAHTQRARYKDVATGEVRVDVLPENRFNPDGLFSEAPDDMATLKLFQPKHLAVMRRLFPNHYQ